MTTYVLELLATGLSSEQILAEMPDLEADDLKAALIYAARKLDHPVLDALDLVQAGERLVEIGG